MDYFRAPSLSCPRVSLLSVRGKISAIGFASSCVAISFAQRACNRLSRSGRCVSTASARTTGLQHLTAAHIPPVPAAGKPRRFSLSSARSCLGLSAKRRAVGLHGRSPLVFGPLLRTARSRLCSQAESKPADAPPAKGFGKVRELFTKYGATGVVIYIGVYLSTLFGLFLGVKSELLPAGDAIGMLRRLGADNIINLDKINPSASNFAVAWILAKFTEPMRMLVTLAITPRIHRVVVRFRAPRPASAPAQPHAQPHAQTQAAPRAAPHATAPAPAAPAAASSGASPGSPSPPRSHATPEPSPAAGSAPSKHD